MVDYTYLNTLNFSSVYSCISILLTVLILSNSTSVEVKINQRPILATRETRAYR